MNGPFWLELIVRSSVILLCAEGLRRWTQAQSAAFRHKLVLWALLLVLLLPVLSVVLPEIRVPVWTRKAAAHTMAGITVSEFPEALLKKNGRRDINWALLIWAAGVVTAAAPMAIGALCAFRVARRARRFPDPLPFCDAEVLLSDEVAAPITLGLRRPRIVLPASAESWSAGRLHAVLLHESAHIRRRDVLFQLCAHLIAALWWFQPLAWLLRNRLRVESELACDAEAVRCGLRPSSYAAELVAVARLAGRREYAFSSCAINMAHGSDLERRVHLILKPGAATARPARTVALVTILTGVTVAASALTLGPGQSSSEQGGSIMKRTLISGLLTSVGLSAATVTGAVHDSHGAAIADASVVVLNPDTGAKEETATDSNGRFSLTGASAGQYILKIEKPGFAPLLREFDLKAESNMDRQLTMSTEGSQPSTDDTVTDSDTRLKPIRIGDQVAESNLITRVQPVYPAAAKAEHTQGTVEIKTTISKDGVPVDLEVVSTPSSDLAESALRAVRQWRYRPTLLNGEPVEIATTVIVRYTLSE